MSYKSSCSFLCFVILENAIILYFTSNGTISSWKYCKSDIWWVQQNTPSYGVPLGQSRHTGNPKQRKHEIVMIKSQTLYSRWWEYFENKNDFLFSTFHTFRTCLRRKDGEKSEVRWWNTKQSYKKGRKYDYWKAAITKKKTPS
jgi:hypothetical protein